MAFCFLENVRDPLNPKSGCYSDTQWSEKDARFWSHLACTDSPDIESGPRASQDSRIRRPEIPNIRSKPRPGPTRVTTTTTTSTTTTTTEEPTTKLEPFYNYGDYYDYYNYYKYADEVDKTSTTKTTTSTTTIATTTTTTTTTTIATTIDTISTTTEQVNHRGRGRKRGGGRKSERVGSRKKGGGSAGGRQGGSGRRAELFREGAARARARARQRGRQRGRPNLADPRRDPSYTTTTSDFEVEATTLLPGLRRRPQIDVDLSVEERPRSSQEEESFLEGEFGKNNIPIAIPLFSDEIFKKIPKESSSDKKDISVKFGQFDVIVPGREENKIEDNIIKDYNDDFPAEYQYDYGSDEELIANYDIARVIVKATSTEVPYQVESSNIVSSGEGGTSEDGTSKPEFKVTPEAA